MIGSGSVVRAYIRGRRGPRRGDHRQRARHFELLVERCADVIVRERRERELHRE
jgi:hypothetical protein